ncbi:glycosyltransferase family 15 protein [Lactarius akahatsu]|uniref:Glycosyltransferase family 15 protein n=1 Tax=Lactarius akahatsu TaxID=416441 RepID=A0AAD4L5Z3_9AGAM|nr:glycosyltransferase family 15 protein [Lactarius akahatsu]
MAPVMRLSHPFTISATIMFCLVFIALLTLHAYSPIVTIPKLSSHTEGGKIPPGYNNNVGHDVSDVYDEVHVAGAVLRANATLLMLSRNSDIDAAVRTVKVLEDRFNRNYRYPWVFLNDQPFTEDFKRRVSILTSGPVYFEKILDEHWYHPKWINETLAQEGRRKMEEDGVIYGGSVSYRNMCRFNSGFFYRQPLLQNYKYYWRVEPGAHFHCDANFDPFAFMQENNKVYGFTITLYEIERTIESLWSTVSNFITEHPEFVSPNSAMDFISDDEGESYNLCHFWSNFEIADMDFWRGPAYTAFFDYLESSGGFYYERWGDAPVHSIAAALFGGTDRIHFFREIGYEHFPATHCPTEEELWRLGRCTCDPTHSFDYEGESCLWRWGSLIGQ